MAHLDANGPNGLSQWNQPDIRFLHVLLYVLISGTLAAGSVAAILVGLS